MEHLGEVLKGLGSPSATGEGKDGDGTRMSEWAVRDSEALRIGVEGSQRERIGLSKRAATY